MVGVHVVSDPSGGPVDCPFGGVTIETVDVIDTVAVTDAVTPLENGPVGGEDEDDVFMNGGKDPVVIGGGLTPVPGGSPETG